MFLIEKDLEDETFSHVQHVWRCQLERVIMCEPNREESRKEHSGTAYPIPFGGGLLLETLANNVLEFQHKHNLYWVTSTADYWDLESFLL